MKKRQPSDINSLCLLAGVLIATFCTGANSNSLPEPLALHGIMEKMGEEMQLITDGISRQEWQQVERSASRVADHPQPPFTEKLRILSFAGRRVSEFKHFDGETNLAALAVARAAVEQNGDAVISAFSTLQTSCLGCHEQFRDAFKQHFYTQPPAAQ